MGQMVYVLGLFFIARIIFSSAVEQNQIKGGQKSRLMLEYNWPEPSKSLNRLPHPRSCHHFIHTKHDGSHVIKRCHRDKIFDYRHLRCLNKSSAKCWMNIVKKGNVKKVKRHFSCPFPWGLYPDKEDCTLFYDCMGGKVYPRKCPDSTLFDIVERICVHSNKALCAEDTDIKTRDRVTSRPLVLFKTKTSEKGDSSANINIITSRIASKSFGTFGIDSEENSSEEESSLKDSNVKYHTKSKNKPTTSKLPSTTTADAKSFRTADVVSKEDSSVERNSSEEVGVKYRTKSENEFITSKLFSSTTIVNLKPIRTTDDDSEENGLEKKDNKINQKYELASPTSDSNYIKDITNKMIPLSTDISTENEPIASSSHGGHSSEFQLQSSTTESLVSTESKSKPVIITATPEISKTDENISDHKTKVSSPTEIISKEFISFSEPFSYKKTDSTTKIPFKPNSSTIHSKTTETIQTDSKSVSTFSALCPDFDGSFPHPKNKHLFIACIGGKPIVKKCPEKLVFDFNTASCVYDEM